MPDDIIRRYNVDINRFYATGFSGGTYASYMIAYTYPDHFRGVIACGAGMGPDNVFMGVMSKKVVVFHCIGAQDFKYKEVLEALDWISKAETAKTITHKD